MNFLKSGWSYLSSSFSQSEDDANESVQDIETSEDVFVENAVNALEVEDQYGDPSVGIEQNTDELAEFADALDIAPLQHKSDGESHLMRQASSTDSQESLTESNGILLDQSGIDDTDMDEAKVEASSVNVDSEVLPSEVKTEENEISTAVMEESDGNGKNQAQGYTSLEASDSDDSGEFIPPPSAPVRRPENTESQLNEIINNLGGDLGILTLEEEDHSEQSHLCEKTLFVTAYDQTICPSPPGNDAADVTLGSGCKFNGNTSPDSAIASSSKSSLCSIDSVKFNADYSPQNDRPTTPQLTSEALDSGCNESASERTFSTSLLDVTVQERLTDHLKDNPATESEPVVPQQFSHEETSQKLIEVPAIDKLDHFHEKKLSVEEFKDPLSVLPSQVTESVVLAEQPSKSLPSVVESKLVSEADQSQLEVPQNLPLDITTEQRAMDDPSDKIPISRGAYTIDFDNLDDFNPFQSKQAISNSPDLSSKPFPGTKIAKEQNVLLDKTPKQQNTAQESNHITVENDVSVTMPDTIVAAASTKENSAIHNQLPSESPIQDNDKTEALASSSNPQDSLPGKKEQANEAEEEAIPVSRGSYSLDFDNLDNMDPFKTSKGLQNSPTMPKSSMSFSPPKSPVKNNIGLLKSMDNKETSSVLSEPGNKLKTAEKDEGSNEKPPTASDLITVDLENVDPAPQKKLTKKPVLGENRKKVAKPKSLKKKPAPFKPPPPPADEEDEIIIPKASYSVNFDDLENMDPFKTSKGLCNSPTKTSSESSFQADAPTAPLLEEKPKFLEDSPGKGSSVDPPGLPIMNEPQDIVKSQLMEDDPIQPEEKKEPIKKSTGAVKKKVKKPSPVKAPPVEADNNEEEILIPKGSYNINFDDLDSMDPFKTSKGLSNSPTEKKPSGYSLDLDNLDSMDPFKPSKAMANSPASSPIRSTLKEEQAEPESKITSEAPVADLSEAAKEIPREREDVNKVKEESPKEKIKKNTGTIEKKVKQPSPVKAPPVEADNDEEEIPIPKGSYNINFDDLDSMDPFKTSKGLSNSPTEEKTSGYSLDLDNLDAVDPFKPSKAMANSPVSSPTRATVKEEPESKVTTEAPVTNPSSAAKEIPKDPEDVNDVKEEAQKTKAAKKSGVVKKKKKPAPVQAPPPEANVDEEEIQIPKGSYNINFDDLDALDPFQSAKGLANSPTEKKPSGYSLGLDNLDGVDPFKSSKAMANSPPGSPKKEAEKPDPPPQHDSTVAADVSREPSELNNDTSKVQKKSEIDTKKKKSGLARKKLLKLGMKKPQPGDENASDEPPTSKGAYNIDFDNLEGFMDPFKSSKGMSNSPTKETAPPISNVDKLDDLDSIDPFKPKTTIMNSPPGSPKGRQESQNEASLISSAAETSVSREALGSVGDVETAFQTANETADFSAIQSPQDLNATPGLEPALMRKEETKDYKQLEQTEFDKINEDEEFYPASSVFQDSASLAYLDKLGGEKSLTARDLKKQSLYVKFDPLVSGSPSKLIDQQISQESESFGSDSSNKIVDKKAQGDFNSTQNSQAASFVASANVSTSFDHHTSMDSYSQSFMNQQSYGSAASSTLKFTQVDLDKALRTAAQSWEKEKGEILSKEATLKSELEQMGNVVKEYDRLFAEMSGNGSRNGMLTREQQLLKAEQEQSLEDMAALERHHEDLCRRYNRLKTVVAQFKQNEDILKKSTNEMMEEARTTEKKYVTLKIKTDEEIKKATDELQLVKANAQQEVARAQAQLKMLELKCESLQSQIKDCNRENEELTKLCDDLIACSKQDE